MDAARRGLLVDTARVLGLILSGVMIAGLLGFLALLRRRERRDRQALGLDRPSISRADPAVVDRPFDPALCAYCEDPSRFSCSACMRPLCAMHRPWLEHQFCAGCETEWEAKSGRRRLIILPIMICAMAVTAGVIGGLLALFGQLGSGASNSKLVLLVMIAPVACAAPVYLGTERFMRRWFRKRGALPQATLRS